ncbi:MAG TPA: PTS fructose-like transporter subunit IIB [Thermoanaerobaculia bacterium]|nr:PTS fructose-like transporter subunit IIB [Thermoanaerobaculia bacterium]
MAKMVAITGCPAGVAHTYMAAAALQKTAAVMGHEIKVETQGSAGASDVLSSRDVAEADVVIVASDIHVDVERFRGKPLVAVPVADAIRKTRAVIENALAEWRENAAAAAAATGPGPGPGLSVPGPQSASQAPAAAIPAAAPADAPGRFLVGVTSCPTGIAHTFLAAEALKKAAAALGHEIRIETQGSVGAKNLLTGDEIARADAVVVAADAFVDTSRFAGKRLFQTSTKAALHDGRGTIEQALALPEPAGDAGTGAAKPLRPARTGRTGPYKHLMTGVSYMLPLVVAGGLLIALAFAIGGLDAGEQQGTLAWALMQIGGGTAFLLYIPVLAAFIAYSIADRPGIAPGLVGGMLATTLGAGFLGGIAAGFLAGYLTKLLNDHIRLPETLQGLKPVLILPLLSTLAVGLVMVFVVGPPVKAVLEALTGWLNGMQATSAVVLGAVLGAMMAVDMGGPLNKSAYTFAVGLLASKVYGPMAAVMAAGMTPPLGLALAALLFKNRFTQEERDAGKAAAVLGLSFVTEGAIPFAARDPLRVIPCLVAGSAVTGAIALASSVELLVPHGGVFVLLIPRAVQPLLPYVLALLAGTLVTTAALYLARRPVESGSEPGEKAAARPAG